MKETLQKFRSSDLRTASLALIDKLGLKYTQGARTSLSWSTLFKKSKLSKAAENALAFISDIYWVAKVDNRTFTDNQAQTSLEEAIQSANDEKYNGIFIFSIRLQEEIKASRTMIADLTRAFNKLALNKPVVLIILQGDSLALSTCERTDKIKDSGEKMGKVNLLRNINCAKPHTGHIRILESLKVSPQINTFDALYKHWFEVFNTKTLTDRFYKDLYNWFMWVVNDPNAHFPENNHLPENENENKNVKIIRLITRLLFVWFIKEKKIKVNNREQGLVPDMLFDEKELGKILNDFDADSENNGEYYNAILQNLFFATLNNEIGERKFLDTSSFYQSKKGYTVKNLFRDNKGEGKSWFKISHDDVLDIFKSVPFLNCGLFECLDKYKRTDISYDIDRLFDGFSTKKGKEYRACLPNRLFFADELPEITFEVTENKKKVPVKIKSKGIINILNEYVFTVEENTPLEQQVSLDPELLGKVFENLLAAYNPETEESVRKSSGSYYTPREIVEYMVNESLIHYLNTKLDEDNQAEEQLRHLVDPSNPDISLNTHQRDLILESLYNCKILDPACGSGAFPMGLLQQMVHIISRLDEKNEKWQELITRKATEETAKAFKNKEISDKERDKIIADITNTFTISKNNPDYTRKLYLIQNCIFGVDIQPIAMMISKLRFFISLICEQDENAINFTDVEHNYGINTLPNLETKFVAANSLLTPDVKTFAGDWTNDPQLEKLKDELMELRYSHVTARTMKKKLEIRSDDDKKRHEIDDYILSTRAHADQAKIALLQDQIVHLMHERNLYKGERIVEEYVEVQASLFEEAHRQLTRKDVNKIKRDDIDRHIRICQSDIAREQSKEDISGFEAAVKQLTEWNPYDQVKSSPFFDPDWMFGIKNGFDIVIGNPPYIRQEKLEYAYKKLLCSIYPDVGDGIADILVYFFGLGINILRDGGILTFITSNKFLKTKYGKNLREKLKKDVDVVSFIDFFELPVFSNASTDAGITLLYNRQPISETKYFPVKTLKDLNLSVLTKGDYLGVIKNETEWQFVKREELSILSKMNDHAISLNDFVNQKIYSGIKTGLNQCFMLKRDVREQILANCASQEEYERTERVIKKAFRSRDVRKYKYTGPEQWLLFIPWHFPLPFETAEKMSPKEALDKAEISLREKYPSLYKYLLSQYEGLAGRNKDETGIRYEWYALQRWGANYYEEFDEEKLIYIHTAKEHEFYYDKEKHYVNNSCYIIVSKSKFLYCFLNSSLFKYYKRIKFVAYGDGAEEGRCKLDGNKMQTVPLKKDVEERPFIEIFSELQDNIDNTKRLYILEYKINIMLYLLYGFSFDEVMLVEKAVGQAENTKEEEGDKTKRKRKRAIVSSHKYNIDEGTYNRWYEQYQKDGTLPTEKEIESIL